MPPSHEGGDRLERHLFARPATSSQLATVESSHSRTRRNTRSGSDPRQGLKSSDGNRGPFLCVAGVEVRGAAFVAGEQEREAFLGAAW